VSRKWPKKLRTVEKQPLASLPAFQEGGKPVVRESGINYRALAVEDETDFIWVWIGSHDEYKRLIKRQG